MIDHATDLHGALIAPFTTTDLEWKVQTCGEKNGRCWALVVPYLSARAIQSRLDEAVGPGGWRNRYEPIMKGGEVAGFLCYLSLRIDGEWVEKCDGAELTDIEPIKGGISNALKRCAVQWGLGRYLYAIDTCWAEIHDNGKERAKTKEGKWFNWDPPSNVGATAPPAKAEAPQGNAQPPRQQPAPAAKPSAAAAAPASKSSTAPTNTPKASAEKPEPSAVELRESKQRADEARAMFTADGKAPEPSVDVIKAKVTELYAELKKIDDPLATVLWRSTAGDWGQKLSAFQIVTFGCQRAREQWGDDKAFETIDYFKNESNWPNDPTTKATAEQVAKLVDLFTTIKPATAAARA